MGKTTVGGIELVISAEATSAKRQIDNLSTSLRNLGGAVNQGGLSALKNGFKGLNSVLAGLGKIDFSPLKDSVSNIKTLSGAINGLVKNTSSSKIEEIAQGLMDLSEWVGAIQFDQAQLNSLERFADAMDRIAKSTSAARNALATFRASNRLMGVSQTDAEYAQSRRNDAFAAFQSAEFLNYGEGAPTQTLVELDESIREGTTQTSPGTSANAIAEAMAQINTFQFRLGLVQGATEPIMNALSNVGAKGREAFEGLANAAGNALTWISKKLYNIIPAVGKLGQTLASAIGTRISNKVTGLTKSLTSLFGSIKRIAMYRLLRTAIREITQGFSEGLKAVSRYDRSINGEFSRTMDSLTSQLALMKGSFGAMAAPLIEMLAPAIMVVTNAVISLANAINQVFSLMSGKNGWTKATSAVQKYDDSVKGASGSTNKLTAAIDELNVLNESSGSGSTSSADYTFEESQFAAWAQNLKQLLDVGNYIEFGEDIADLINEAIDDWDANASGRKLGQKIQHGIEIAYGFIKSLDTEELGSKIAAFLNSGIEQIDTYMLGETFGEKWNRVVDLVYGFVTDFDFVQLADKITDWVKGALEAFNVDKLSNTVTELASGLLGFISETVETFPLTDMIDAIFEFFNGINWLSLGNQVGALAGDLVIKIADVLCNLFENHDITETALSIAKFIGGAIEGIDWKLLGLYISKLVWVICQDIDSMLAYGIPAAVEAVITKSDFSETMQIYMEKSAEDGFTLVYDAADKALRDIDKLIANEIESQANKAKESSAEIVDNIGSACEGITSAYQSTYEKVSTTAVELGNAMAQPWASADWGKQAEAVGTQAAESFTKTQEVVSTSWSQIKKTTATDWDEIQKKVADTWKLMSTECTTKMDEIVKTVTDKWIELKSATNIKFGTDGEIYVLVENALAQIQGAFAVRFDGETSIQNFVVGAFDTMGLGIAAALETTYTHIDNFVTNSITRLGDLIREIQNYNTEASGSDLDIEFGGVNAYASGGFPSMGQLFVANEAGAEMVGSIDGHTAVANNQDIVTAVSSGVYAAVTNAMSGNSSNKAQSINIYLDGKQIEASVRSTKQRRGASIANGGVYNFA